MIAIKFKHADEVTLRCALHARGVDPADVDVETVRVELVDMLQQEIRRHQTLNPPPAAHRPGPGPLISSDPAKPST